MFNWRRYYRKRSLRWFCPAQERLVEETKSFFIKVRNQVFSCEFCEISKNTFFTERLRMTAFIKSRIRSLKAKENMSFEAQILQAFEYINDSYRKINYKKIPYRGNREEIFKHVYLFEFLSKIFHWKSFSQNNEKKEALADLFSQYLICKCLPQEI